MKKLEYYVFLLTRLFIYSVIICGLKLDIFVYDYVEYVFNGFAFLLFIYDFFEIYIAIKDNK